MAHREKRIKDRKMFPRIQETKKYCKTNLDFQFMHRERKTFFHLSLKKKKKKKKNFKKSRNKTNRANYRPILLLSVLSKFPEKHVHIYLNDYLEKLQSLSVWI